MTTKNYLIMIPDTLLFISLSVSLTYLCCQNVLWFILFFLCAIPNIRINKSWLNWFEITKLLSCILGLVVLHFYPQHIQIILIINILEAIIKDKYLINSLFGCLVIFILNPQSMLWVVLYSAWNALFTYTYGFSWSTRVQLLTPIILFDMWIEARVYSLLLNMLMRATECVYLFQPGKSYLTF